MARRSRRAASWTGFVPMRLIVALVVGAATAVSVAGAQTAADGARDAVDAARERDALRTEELLSQRSRAIAEIYADGQRLYDDGRYDEAAAQLAKVLALDPEHRAARRLYDKARDAGTDEKFRAEFEKGRLHWADGEYAQAVRAFERALEFDPGNSAARRYLESAKEAVAEMRTEARAEFENRRRQRQQAAEHIRKGEQLRDEGRYAQAIVETSHVIDDNLVVPADPLYQDAEQLIVAVRTEAQEREAERLRRLRVEQTERMILQAARAWVPPNVVDKVALGSAAGVPATAKITDELAKGLQKLVTVDAENEDLLDVLADLSEKTQVNIVPHESVRAPDPQTGEPPELRVTAYVRNPIPLASALDLLVRAKGLHYELSGNIVSVRRIAPGQAALETRVFTLESIPASLQQILESTVPRSSSELMGGGGEDSSITVSPATRSVIIRNTPANIRIAEQIISDLDEQPRQILIEAKFLEVTATNYEDFGIDWQELGNQLDANRTYDVSVVTGGLIPRAGGSAGALLQLTRLADWQVNLIISALEESEKAKVLSSPRIVTVNNHPAYITSGSSVPFPISYSVEEVELEEITTVTTTAEVTDERLVVDDVSEYTVGVRLSVTPSVSEGSNVITLVITPRVTEFVEWSRYPTDVPTFISVRMPTFVVREVQTKISVADGETVMLGGLIRNARSEVDRGLPWVHRAPVIGSLFGGTYNRDHVSNLIIFVTAKLQDTRVAGVE